AANSIAALFSMVRAIPLRAFPKCTTARSEMLRAVGCATMSVRDECLEDVDTEDHRDLASHRGIRTREADHTRLEEQLCSAPPERGAARGVPTGVRVPAVAAARVVEVRHDDLVAVHRLNLRCRNVVVIAAVPHEEERHVAVHGIVNAHRQVLVLYDRET